MNSSIDGTKDEVILQQNLFTSPCYESQSKRMISAGNAMSHLSTENLLLRPIEPADKALYRDIFSDPEVTRYTGGAVIGERLNLGFNQSVEALKASPINYITWVVRTKKPEVGIGILNLTLHDRPCATAELGIMFKKAYQNKGFCCELLAMMVAYCFNQINLTSLYCFTMDDNKAVSHVLQKLNFEQLTVSPYEQPTSGGSYWGICRVEEA